MNILKIILLAILQGISEILPISSSGHLIVVENLLGMEGSPLSLAIVLHFGSLVAVVAYYWKDIWKLICKTCSFLFKKNRDPEVVKTAKLFLCWVIATIPAALIGVLANDIIEEKLTNLYFVFAFFSVTGALLLISQKLKGQKKMEDMSYKDALFIGCFQAIGILPGISRSGITIVGGKSCGYDNEGSANFSFLMFIPITLGSFILELVKVFKGGVSATFTFPIYYYLVGVILAGVVTYFSLMFLLKIIKKGKLYYFSFYLFLISIAGIIYLLATHYGF